MFGIDARQLCSITSHTACARWFDRTKKPRNWEDNERPLKDKRSTHFALRKVGDTYECRLHRTAVVTWVNDNECILDSSYDSTSTRAFADRYLPAGRTYTHNGQNVFQLHGTYFSAKKPIHLRKEGGVHWSVVGDVEKATRKVLDPDKAYEINQRLKPFAQWVRAMWAISGEPGHHPWVGQETTVSPFRYGSLQFAQLIPENYVALVEDATPRVMQKYIRCDVEAVLKKIRNRLQNGAYIDIPYDAPLPKRKEKK